MADIDDDDARRQLRFEHERRQHLAVAANGLIAGLQAQLLQRVRADPGLPRRADEGAQVEVFYLRAGDAGCRGQTQWFDADQPHRQRPLAGKAQTAFQQR
ncbi:hypothetical protein D3C77_458940 [compost metagenome]